MEQKRYDLIVVGGGSGLNVSSFAAEHLGWKVAVVEKGPLGGTCLNRGCIPSKMIIHAADVAETITTAHKFGIKAEIKDIDFAAVTTRASAFVDAEAEQIRQSYGQIAPKATRLTPGVDLFQVEAHFVDAFTLQVGADRISADHVLVAAGTRPSVPEIAGLSETPFITSDEALRLTKQPRSMIIVGGGYISCELGHFYGALGTDVTILERGNRLIGREDGEIADVFTEVFSRKYNVMLGYATERVERRGDGVAVTVKNDAGETRVVEGDVLLVATGRRPNSDLLKIAENTDIKLDEKGFVVVNEFMETSVPNVWALGDIVGKAPFKHGANWEAEHIVANLHAEAHAQHVHGAQKRAVDYTVVPHAIFSSPQIAGVGLTEEDAKARGIAYEVRKYAYINTGMGKAMEEEDGFVKFVVDPKRDVILGCHIMGSHASILIHEVIVAMAAAGGKISAIVDSIHIHPSLPEVVQRAL